MSYQTFICAKQLNSIIYESGLIIFDCSFDLAQPKKEYKKHLKAHIPGAFYADLEKDLSSEETAESGAHPLPDIQKFTDFLAGHGVDNDTQIVAYDNINGAFAARLWWMVKYIGHKNVAVLIGGRQNWQAEGFKFTARREIRVQSKFIVKPALVEQIEAPQLVKNLSSNEYQLIDSREFIRFTGQREPYYTKAGHIPGAKHYYFLDNFDENNLKSTARLNEQFNRVLKKPIEKNIFYCGSGVTAALNILCLQHIGKGSVKLYVGSWSHWIKDDQRPISIGE